MKTFLPPLAILALSLAVLAQTNSTVAPDTLASASGTPVITAIPTVSTASTNVPSERPPTEIFSDGGEFNLKSNIFVYRGNVRVDDPQMKLTCELLTVEAPRQANGRSYWVTAERRVVIDFSEEPGMTNHATAEKAIYTYRAIGATTNAFVEFIGSPVITNLQGRGQIKGDLIVWDRIQNTVYVTNQQTTVRSTGTNAPPGFSPLSVRRTNAPAIRPTR